MPRLKPGDRIEVTWEDIQEAGGGDPEDAELFTWQTEGRFVRTKRSKGKPCLVLRSSRGENEKDKPDRQSGWSCIPIANISKIRRLNLGAEISIKSLEAE